MGDRRGGGPGPIPKRWLRCPRKSDRLIDKKFLAFKTPLDSKFDDQVPPECCFTPEILLGSLRNYKANVGLWIDLTFTKRFYESRKLEDKGIKYVKLECRGHGETPTVDQTQAFNAICSQFIKQRPLDIVGVHCTHGFNRTGFLIVSYLIEKEDWALDRALVEFANCRPPGIYKQDYLDELHRRYGDDSEPRPVAPLLPDWCYDEEDGEDDPARNGHAHAPALDPFSAGGPSREPQPSEGSNFMIGVEGVTQVVNKPLLMQIQKKIQSMCNYNRNGFPGSQPVSMVRENIEKLSEMPYMVSWKADGTRYMMLIDGVEQVFLVDRDNRVFRAPNLRFPKRKDPNGHLTNTLVDGEMVIDKVNNQDVPRFLIYDIIKIETQSVGETDFGTRLMCIRREIIEPRAKATAEGRLNKAMEPFSVRLKEFYDLSKTSRLLSDQFKSTLAHEPDGLVFQPVKIPYSCGRCDNVLKWKPSDMNSVDFKLQVEVSAGGEGTLKKKRGLLYVGRQKEPFAEIPLTAELRKLDGKIVECHFDFMGNCWKFMRERTDKSFPNDISTARSVCNSIQFPVTEEYLLDYIAHQSYARVAAPANPLPPPLPPPVRGVVRKSEDGFVVPNRPAPAKIARHS